MCKVDKGNLEDRETKSEMGIREHALSWGSVSKDKRKRGNSDGRHGSITRSGASALTPCALVAKSTTLNRDALLLSVTLSIAIMEALNLPVLVNETDHMFTTHSNNLVAVR